MRSIRTLAILCALTITFGTPDGSRRPRADQPAAAAKSDRSPVSAHFYCGRNGVNGLAFARNGRVLITAHEDQRNKCVFRRWNCGTGAFTEVCAENPDPVPFGVHPDQNDLFLSLSADGNEAVFCGEGSVCVVDSGTGRLLRQIKQRNIAASLSPDGKLLLLANGFTRPGDVAGKEGEIAVLEIATGKTVYRVPRNDTDGRVFFASGNSLVGIGPNSIRLWKLPAQGRGIRVQTPPGINIEGVALSPDGKILAAGCMHVVNSEVREGKIFWWEVATGKLIHISAEEIHAVFAIGFSPDGKTLASDGSGEIRLWDSATAKCSLLIRSNRGPFGGLLRFSPDGNTLASIGGDRFIHLWDVRSGRDRAEGPGHLGAAEGPGHLGAVTAIAFAANGHVLATSSQADRTVRLWDTVTGRPLQVFRGDYAGTDLVFDAEAKELLSGDEHFLALCSLRSGNGTVRLLPITPCPAGLAGEIVSPGFATGAGYVQAVVAEASEYESTFHGEGHARASSRRRIWDRASGEPVKDASVAVPQYAIRVSPDGKTAVSETGVVFDVATGVRLFKIFGGREFPTFTRTRVVFSPDSRLLAADTGNLDANGGVSAGILRVWEVVSRDVVKTMQGQPGVELPLFSPDGSSLAGRSLFSFKEWNPVTGEEFAQDWTESESTSFAFSPDGGTLACGKEDGTIVLRPLKPPPWLRVVPRELPPEHLARAWSDLAVRDAGKGQAAVRLLASSLSSVRFLHERLRPAATVSPKRIRELISRLSDRDFSSRDDAYERLRSLGRQAEDGLRAALKSNPLPETAGRVGRLLESLTAVPPAETLRAIRAIQALEIIGSEEACKVLLDAASGAPEAQQTCEARAALQRATARTGKSATTSP